MGMCATRRRSIRGIKGGSLTALLNSSDGSKAKSRLSHVLRSTASYTSSNPQNYSNSAPKNATHPVEEVQNENTLASTIVLYQQHNKSIILLQSAFRRFLTTKQIQKFHKQKNMRNRIVEEIVSTERTYVKQLDTLQGNFVGHWQN